MLALARPALAAGAAAARRALSVSLPPGASGAAAGVAKELEDKIVARLSGTTKASVTDTSGGCGTMYNIEVESNSFDGLSTVKQHKLVADILKVRPAVPFESCARHGARAAVRDVHVTPSGPALSDSRARRRRRRRVPAVGHRTISRSGTDSR